MNLLRKRYKVEKVTVFILEDDVLGLKNVRTYLGKAQKQYDSHSDSVVWISNAEVGELVEQPLKKLSKILEGF